MGYPTWEGASTLIGGGAHTVENPKNQESFQNIAHKKKCFGIPQGPTTITKFTPGPLGSTIFPI